MITWFALALATDVRATDDPVLAAIDRIAEASGRNFWAWYAEDPCGGHDPGLASRPEPGHPFAATMEVRRALAATQTLAQVVDTWNAAGGRRLVIDHDDSDRIVVTLMGLDETCTREIGPDPAFLQATIAPAMYVGGQGVEDVLAQLPRPLETGVMVSANARWIVREPSTLIDALLRPAPGQLGRLTGIYSVKETGPLIWFGGSLRPPEPEELGPPPPLPRPTPAEKLLDQRRSYLHLVDTVAAGVHLHRRPHPLRGQRPRRRRGPVDRRTWRAALRPRRGRRHPDPRGEPRARPHHRHLPPARGGSDRPVSQRDRSPRPATGGGQGATRQIPAATVPIRRLPSPTGVRV